MLWKLRECMLWVGGGWETVLQKTESIWKFWVHTSQVGPCGQRRLPNTQGHPAKGRGWSQPRFHSTSYEPGLKALEKGACFPGQHKGVVPHQVPKVLCLPTGAPSTLHQGLVWPGWSPTARAAEPAAPSSYFHRAGTQCILLPDWSWPGPHSPRMRK